MYVLHKSSQQDIDIIAPCYKACFPGSLSARLGKAYMHKTLAWFFAVNRFLFHVTNNNNEVLGFCGGFIPLAEGDGSTSSIMQYTMQDAAKAVLKKPWLLLAKEIRGIYPLIFKNLVKKILKRSKKKQQATSENFILYKAGLVVIGVHPKYRGSGVFEMLMKAFDEAALSRGLLQLHLSVKPENMRAVNAYKKCGWHITKQTDKAIEMNKTLNKSFA